ncbi:hypothetical protein E2562_025566 [Oryza meyeriana var. granulata]|uniref:Uncharacterized protein n=1 Tax=Oryza meyeriana var. granulata TaxID=110450 RepID=A0A6G1FC42_9ORYZ|nr:hypothetical protein E2562_025566 [Oryza meyeriana var. granulata]
MAPPKKSRYIMKDLKTIFARASISANSNRDPPEPEGAIDGQQQEEPQENEDVGLEVPVDI